MDARLSCPGCRKQFPNAGLLAHVHDPQYAQCLAKLSQQLNVGIQGGPRLDDDDDDDDLENDSKPPSVAPLMRTLKAI
jgi:hypothetical protein